MITVAGVRFRTAGKIYFFDPAGLPIHKGDHVIVETARGIEFGTVVGELKEVEEDKVISPLKPVLRIANQRDEEQEAANKQKEKDAFVICQEKIRKHGLEMKPIDAEYTFDNNKVLFYFTADGRIDFRELVKDLASVFRTRIELRQIGVRDETKTMGGIGICGRVLCCHSYLSEFIPVSIKMAKEQNLSLNPAKISGVCGRLMCCLKHEEENYEDLNRRLPNVGDVVTTDDGLKGEVQSVNVLRQLVKVLVEVDDEKEIREYETDRLKFKKHYGKKDRSNISSEGEMSSEELEELELLEKQEEIEIAEMAEKDGKETIFSADEQPENRRMPERQNRRFPDQTEGRSKRTGQPGANRQNRRFGKDRANGEERQNGGGRQNNAERPNNAERTNGAERQNNAERSNNTERANGTERSNQSRRMSGERRRGVKERSSERRQDDTRQKRSNENRQDDVRPGRNGQVRNEAADNKEGRKGKPRRYDNRSERKGEAGRASEERL